MDPTSLPTDNLWKFMALGGLALAGFCAWFRWRLLEADVAETQRLSEEAARHAAITNTFVERSKAFSKRVQEIRVSVSSGRGVDPSTQEEITRKLALIEADADRTRTQLEDIQPDRAALRDRVEARSARVRDRGAFAWLLLVGMVLSGGLSGVGFGGWYINVQWYTDRQAKADFEDHMQELAAKRIAREKAAREAKP